MIKKLKESFKDDLKYSNLNIEEIFSKYYLENPSYFFNEIIKDSYEEFRLRRLLASHLGVFQREIVLVGSGKTGFSVKPEDPFGWPLTDFREGKSDLDFAIINSSYFDNVSDKIYEKYIKNQMPQPFNNSAFLKYHFKGWIRPDHLPKDFVFSEELKQVLVYEAKKLGVKSINLAVYKSWKYFFNYHENNLHKLKLNLIAE